MASQTLILQNPTFLSPQNPRTRSVHTALNNHHPLLGHLSKPRIIISLRKTAVPTLSLSSRKPKISSAIVAASSSTDVYRTPASAHSLLTGSTRTITTLAAIVLVASKVLFQKIVNLGLQSNVRQSLIQSVGPAFFAAVKDQATGTLNTPFTVVAAGMAKWLDIYSGVLMVRVLLSWFPNIPWDRQPLSAIRDLCDPYLNLFRNIIPPIFDTLDVSPLLAFAVLGTLGSILNSTRGGY